MNRKTTLLRSLYVAALALPLIVFGQQPKPSPRPNRIVIDPNGLPKPFHTESVRNPPRVIPRPDGAKLELPEGFDLSVFSEGDYIEPRWIIEGPNGDLFLADSSRQANAIFLLRDSNK
ncbi:MAG TPA: hypothetical protein VIM99_10130, partial [Blastocatellia bacterium]